MDLTLFKEQMELMEEGGGNLDAAKRDEIILKSIARVKPEIKHTIAMEELAECSQAISKLMRMKYYSSEEEKQKYRQADWDEVGLSFLEEIADVYICLMMLRKINGVMDDVLMNAIDVKLMREEERCE